MYPIQQNDDGTKCVAKTAAERSAAELSTPRVVLRLLARHG